MVSPLTTGDPWDVCYQVFTSNNFVFVHHRKEMEPDVKHRCNFYIEDADKMEFPENFFDVVYR